MLKIHRKLLTTVLSISACGGCAAPGYFKVDVRFTPVEQSLIRDAASNWEIATGEQINLAFGERVDLDPMTNTWSIIRASSRDPEARELFQTQSDGYEQQGLCSLHWSPVYHNERLLIVADEITATDASTRNEVFLFTVMHELGHHFRIPHVESQTAVMQPTVGLNTRLPNCVTWEDAAAYCAVHADDGCHADEMHGCRFE